MNIFLNIRGTTVLRIGICFVFLWFSFQQFLHPEQWVGFIPEWVTKLSPIGPITLIHINGALELVFATSLLLGLFTRASALILALHMGHITTMIGYSSIGVRDFGLTVAMFAVFLDGADNLTLDQILLFPQNKIEPEKPQAQDIPPQKPISL